MKNTQGKITSDELNKLLNFLNQGLKVIKNEDKQIGIRSNLFGSNCFMVSYLFKYVIKELFPPLNDILTNINKETGIHQQEKIILELKSDAETLRERIQQLGIQEKDIIENNQQMDPAMKSL